MKPVRIITVLTFIVLLAFITYKFELYEKVQKSVSTIKSGKEVTFFIASDTHYLAKSLSDGGEAYQKFVNDGDGKELNYIQEIMDAFAYDIKKKKPDVLVVSGDLTANGEKESHIELAKRLKDIEKSGTAVYVIPGNHDINNPFARSFKGGNQYIASSINDTDFAQIYGDFGYKEAVSRDKNTLSYLAAPSEDVWLLMLDTAQYKDNYSLGIPQLEGRIDAGTMEWINKCSEMAKAKGAKIVTVMHHNLLNHSETVRKGFTIDNIEEAIRLFQQNDLNLTLSGHIHLQDIKSSENSGKFIYDIASASLPIYPLKYGIMKYSDKNGIDYITQNVNVEAWARENGIVNDILLNFSDYSRKFYGDRLYKSVVSKLAFEDVYTSEEIRLMGETYSTLYVRYYDGEKETADNVIQNSPGLKLWLNAEQSSYKRNVLRLLNIDGEINNKLHIENSGELKK